MYNILKHSITKRTPFFINKGFKADILLETKKCEELVLYTATIVDKIYKLQDKLRQDLIFFNKVIKKFANRKKIRELTFKKKDKVYLLQKISNIKIIFI